jgi:hypothetical protein
MVNRTRLLVLGTSLVAGIAAYPNRHLVAGEAFVLRPLPGKRTRLIIRYRGMGYISTAAQGAAANAPALTKAIAFALHHVPGAMLLARGIDLLIADPLHHYMEVGVLRGVKQRAEGLHDGVRDAVVKPLTAAT